MIEAVPVTERTGLTDAQAIERLAADGPNELPVSKPRGLLRLMLEVVTEPMFLLLVACGALYMLLGDRQEALMLLGFVFVVMGITLFQQRRTERSLEALRGGGRRRSRLSRRAPRTCSSACARRLSVRLLPWFLSRMRRGRLSLPMV